MSINVLVKVLLAALLSIGFVSPREVSKLDPLRSVRTLPEKSPGSRLAQAIGALPDEFVVAHDAGYVTHRPPIHNYDCNGRGYGRVSRPSGKNNVAA